MESQNQSSWLSRITTSPVCGAIVFIIPLLVFLPVIQSGFVADDYGFIQLYKMTLGDFLEAVQKIHSGDIFIHPVRPSVFVSFCIDHKIWGLNPTGFHLTNLLIHSLNAFLLFRLGMRIGLNKIASICSSLIFGLYPTSSEAVIWVSGRFDLLSFTFVLLSVLLWITGRLRNSGFFMSLSVLSVFIAVFAKETAIVTIAILPILDIYLKRRYSYISVFPRKWLFYQALSGFSIVVFRLLIFRSIGGAANPAWGKEYFDFSSGQIINAFNSAISVLFAPVSSFVWNDLNPVIQISLILLGAIALTSLIFALWFLFDSGRAGVSHFGFSFLFALVLIIFPLVPILPLNPVLHSFEQTRYLYYSSSGIAILIGFIIAVSTMYDDKIKMLSVSLAAGLILTSVFLLSSQNQIWVETSKIAVKNFQVLESYKYEIIKKNKLIYVNLPWTLNGALLSPNGFPGYLCYEYPEARIVEFHVTKSPDELREWMKILETNPRQDFIVFVFDNQTNELSRYPIEPIPVSTERKTDGGRIDIGIETQQEKSERLR